MLKIKKVCTLSIVLLLVMGALLSGLPSITYASTDEGNNEENSSEEETEPEPEPESESIVEPLPEAALAPEPETIECPEGYVLDNDNDKCIVEPLTELGELVGPPSECPPELSPLECLDEVVSPPSPSPSPIQEPPVVETETETETETEEPIDPCLLDPGHESCPEPDENGECPEGYTMNGYEQCYPKHDRCPDGYHSHEDDETGKCIPDSTPCQEGYIMDPRFPTCSSKEYVCRDLPEIDECKTDDDDDDDDDDDVDVKVINKVVNIVKNVNDRGRENFPEIDIIGLSTKQNGDSMVCLMNIDEEHVQCQEFGMASDRVNGDFWRIIETDQDKDYDNGNTGSDDIDGVIDDIKDQDFSELDDATNHDFDIDMAWIAINPQGDGVACLAEDSTGKGKSLCEPFKVTNEDIDGQITEGVGIENS